MYTTRGKPKMAGKKPSHRDAIIKSLLIELIRGERLQTTPTKVKILKQEFDKLVNTAKQDTEASRRNVESKLTSTLSVEKLYSKILPRLGDTTSGYTISARTLPRKGDNAAQTIVMIKGTEVKEKRSKLAATLEKQDKSAKSEGVAEKIKKAVSGPRKMGGDSKKKDSVVNVRRNSK
jgi:large subunit ribosomal protein L17